VLCLCHGQEKRSYVCVASASKAQSPSGIETAAARAWAASEPTLGELAARPASAGLGLKHPVIAQSRECYPLHRERGHLGISRGDVPAIGTDGW
jgi:hypothetical protein